MNNKFQRILKFINENKIENATINDDYTVDVNGNVDLSHKNLHYIPIKFNHVTGDFDCSYNNLTSLNNCPKKTDGVFDCTGNEIDLEKVKPENFGNLFLYDENKNLDLIRAKCLSESKLLKEDVKISELDMDDVDNEDLPDEIYDKKRTHGGYPKYVKPSDEIDPIYIDFVEDHKDEIIETYKEYIKEHEDEIEEDKKKNPHIYKDIKIAIIYQLLSRKKDYGDRFEKYKNKLDSVKNQVNDIESKFSTPEEEVYNQRVPKNIPPEYKDIYEADVKFIKEHNITGAIINPRFNYSIDVVGSIILKDIDLGVLPVKFLRVTGSFIIKNCKLTSLEGVPGKVGGNFDCSDNLLKSLENSPYKVAGDFNCSNNPISSLNGISDKIGGSLDCSNCEIENLIGCPESLDGSLNCSNNKQLNSLEGAPIEINGNFDCSNCHNLDSLINGPEYVSGDYHCEKTIISSLDGIGKVNGNIYSTFKDEIKQSVMDDKITGGKIIVNDDGTLTINGSVYLKHGGYSHLLWNFYKVTGDFDISDNKITSLEGCPKIVGGNFNCSNTLITSLEGGPEKVGGGYICSNCKELASLDGAPEEVGAGFFCYRTNINDDEFDKLNPKVKEKVKK